MTIKKVKQKLHRILFPDESQQIKDLTASLNTAHDTLKTTKKEISEIRDQIKTIEKEKPTMADLMRDNLGLIPIDFYHVDEKGIPKHFLDLENKDKRSQYINELYSICQTEVFEVMCKNHIDIQGNFSLRQSGTFEEDLAGRFSINGISLIRNEVRRGAAEYVERSKPPEEFDQFETTEGVPIKNDN